MDDAVLLWEQNRREGAFLSILIAVAASARKRYPNRSAVNDGDAFRLFLEASRSVRIAVEYRSVLWPVEKIFYTWFRCELVHEGGLPVDIEFMPEQAGILSVRAGGAPEYILKVSDGWFWHLARAVIFSPENEEVFREMQQQWERSSRRQH